MDACRGKPGIPKCFGTFGSGSAVPPRGCTECLSIVDCIRTSSAPTTFEQEVRAVLDNLAIILVEKNRKYGDSALSPKRVFSRASAVEQIKVRLDDKISRLMNQQPDEDEDVELDLMGYLVLLRIARRRV